MAVKQWLCRKTLRALPPSETQALATADGGHIRDVTVRTIGFPTAQDLLYSNDSLV
jgi:hypothetical protein